MSRFPVGVWLREAREKYGWTQDDVGHALGVNRVMVSYWETGVREPTDAQLSAMAWMYGWLAVAEALGSRRPDIAAVLLAEASRR